MSPSCRAALLLVVVCVALTTASPPVPNPLWKDLRVKFSHDGAEKGYFQMPRTVAEARTKGYVAPPEGNATPMTNVHVVCPHNDPTVCLIYDKKGNIAGMQIGVQKKGLVKTGYPFEKHPSFVSSTRFGVDLYITTLYFVQPSVLKAGGRASLAEHGTGTGLWLQNGQDEVPFAIPRLEKDLGKTLFKKNGCYNGMGYHYYYNLSNRMLCEDFFPIFGLYKNGEMIGFGFHTFGTQTPIAKEWFETVSAAAGSIVMPDPPQCLAEYTNKHITLHTYFVGKPWDIKC